MIMIIKFNSPLFVYDLYIFALCARANARPRACVKEEGALFKSQRKKDGLDVGERYQTR